MIMRIKSAPILKSRFIQPIFYYIKIDVFEIVFFLIFLGFIFSISTIESAMGQDQQEKIVPLRGYMFIVMQPKIIQSSEQESDTDPFKSLWSPHHKIRQPFDVLEMDNGIKFVHTFPDMSGVLSNRSYNHGNDMDFGIYTIAEIGNYRCQFLTNNYEDTIGSVHLSSSRSIKLFKNITRITHQRAGDNNSLACIGPPVKVHEGDDATMICETDSFFGMLFVEWFKDGAPINIRAILLQTNGDNNDGIRKYSITHKGLQIFRVDENDKGIYECAVDQMFEGNREFKVVMAHELRIEKRPCKCSCTMSWHVPLLIIAGFILAFILIIFGYFHFQRKSEYGVMMEDIDKVSILGIGQPNESE